MGLARALYALISTQAVVVAATLSVPVLGPAITSVHGLPPAAIGWHTSIVFASAIVCAQASPYLVNRFGGILLSQLTALVAAIALVSSATLGVPGLLIGAVLLGAAYAQSNTASGVVLNGLVSPKSRNLVFSLKQTSVPIGGVMAGLLPPMMLSAQGWQIALWLMAALALVIALTCGTRRTETGQQTPRRQPSISPVRVLRKRRRVRLMAGVALILAAVQFTMASVFVVYLSSTRDIPIALAGQLLSIGMVSAVGVRILFGVLADRSSAILLLVVVAFSIGAASLVLILSPNGYIAATAVTVLLTTGFSWNGLFLAEVARIVPKRLVSGATAAGMTAVFFGGALAPAAFASMAASRFGYDTVFAVFASLALICAGLLAVVEQLSAADQKSKG